MVEKARAKVKCTKDSEFQPERGEQRRFGGYCNWCWRVGHKEAQCWQNQEYTKSNLPQDPLQRDTREWTNSAKKGQGHNQPKGKGEGEGKGKEPAGIHELKLDRTTGEMRLAVGCRDDRPIVDSGSVVSTCPVDYAMSVPKKKVNYFANFVCVLTRSTTAEFQHNDMMMRTNVQNDLRLEMALVMWIVSVHEKSEQL